jgi:azurin
MSEITGKLNGVHHTTRVESLGSPSPTWWVMFLRELHSLWIGGKAPILLFLFSIVMGFNTFVTAYNVELSIMPPKEMVYETLKTAIAVGIFIGMIIGADAISGERERGTLEALLLTPAARRQLIIGKFLAALTPWPAALLLCIPYMAVLAQGDEVLGPAILEGAILGTLMAVAYTGTGMLVSFWANSNRTSYLVCLGLYILILVPAQLPGRAQAAAAGQFLQALNPLAAVYHFLSKTLVNNRTVEEFRGWLLSPVLFAVLVLILLFLYAAPGLRLEAGRAAIKRWKWGRVASLLVLVLVCLSAILATSVASAHPQAQSQKEQPANTAPPLQISVDLAYQTVKNGDAIFFDTVVTNLLAEESPPTIVAMNIINLDREGDVVDPEDWSPERTQYLGRLAPGQSATLSWRVNAIVDGNYVVYMVAMPQPAGSEATSQAAASRAIHLTVKPFTRLNPRGILPLTLGTPIVLGLATFLTVALRRRETEGSGSNTGFWRFGLVGVAAVLLMGILTILATASQSDPTRPVSEQSQSSVTSPILLEIDTAAGATEFKYIQETLEAPAGSKNTLKLNNKTKADDEVGHNWVLVKPGKEASVLASGLAAGDDKDWLDVNDPGIIAHTNLIEGEQSDSVTFDAPAPGTYIYICTFPKHYAGGMKGTLVIK